MDDVGGLAVYRAGGVELPGVEVTAVQEGASRPCPGAIRLGQNFPNPFNDQTMVPCELPSAGRVELVLYGLTGQVVRRLVAIDANAGPHLVTWDGRDDQGRNAASGMYLCRLVAGGQEQVRRLVLLR